ncbi:MAG: hypothetical protein J5I93_05020 [Pirellulaceae bacterium]|nr:hypothetical protein [Pirellulaceae bacterium]
MKCVIKAEFQVLSDFHLGSGSGRGRTIDAQVLKDALGRPYLPGSSIKGLARAHACNSIAPALTEFRDVLEAVFGIQGHDRGWFYFHDARLRDPQVRPRPAVVGRSSRSPKTGATEKHHLFYNEVAAGATFEGLIEAEDLPDGQAGSKAVLLVMMALRRIEALGASRRRGLGQCQVKVTLVEPAIAAERSIGGGPLVIAAMQHAADVDSAATPSAPRRHWLQSALESIGQPGTGEPAEFALPELDREGDSDWTCLPLYAEAVTPLVMAADQGPDNIINSLGYVPGSTIRGAVAWWFLQRGLSAGDAVFQELIVGERLRFGPLYPVQSFWSDRRTMPFPLPLSFVECKDQPGALRPDRADTGHGVTDRLFWPGADTCGCGEALTGLDGWGTIAQPTPTAARITFRFWSHRLQTIQRTAIDSATTQRARAGQLYATESIPEGSWLAGYIWGPKWGLDWLKSTILNGKRFLRVGKSRTRGHGKVCLWREASEDKDFLAARDDTYPLVYRAGGLSQTPPDDGFTLYCYSDLIAVDEFLRPVTTLDASCVWKLVGGCDSPPFQCDRAYVATSRTTGFNGLAQLPRTADLGLAAGSAARFRWTSDDQSVRGDAWKLLRRAHREGIGLRRGEGFGRIMLDPPFHAARARQNALVGSDGTLAEDSELIAADAHAAHIPNSSARTNLDPRRMSENRVTGQKKARELAEKCANQQLRAAAARLLWTWSWDLDPQRRLSDWCRQLDEEPGDYERPRDKPDLTSKQLSEFLRRVGQHAPSAGVPEYFRYLAECLESELPNLRDE